MADIQDVFQASRATLNDTIVPGGTIYNNDALLPFVKIANNELGDFLVLNGVTVQKQIVTEILVPAGTTELDAPDNMINPVALYEKNVGAPRADYYKMGEGSWGGNTPRDQYLHSWMWRGQKIQFNGSTIPKDVRLDYIRLLADILDEDSLVEVVGSSNFLSFRTAALAARHIGENPIKANELDIEAIRFRDNLLQIGVRKGQSIRGRRRPFRLRFLSRYI